MPTIADPSLWSQLYFLRILQNGQGMLLREPPDERVNDGIKNGQVWLFEETAGSRRPSLLTLPGFGRAGRPCYSVFVPSPDESGRELLGTDAGSIDFRCEESIFANCAFTVPYQSRDMARHLHLLLCLLVLARSFDEISARFEVDHDTIQAYASTKQVENWDVSDEYPDSGRVRMYNIQADEQVDVGNSRKTGNPIDDCWRLDSNWAYNRQALARCAVGFGAKAIGGANGPVYVVTDDADDDLVNPAHGSLRYGVLQDGPLWIGFSRDMNIKLKNELIVSSFKTIDGRGFNIHISEGGGLTLQFISNVIIHGVHFHDLKATGPAVIRSNATHAGHRQGSDGDAVSIFGSHDIWVDHCYFARGPDGLVDAVMGSTAITVSNSYFERHDKVMLFGAHPSDTMDQGMQITVAFNHFGPGLIERMPRVRHGNVHVLNNVYDGWGMYAIGGSEGPTIVSEGNVFNAPNTNDKQVTKRIDDGDPDYAHSRDWNWQSDEDLFLNGAYFVAGGAPPGSSQYHQAVSMPSCGVPVDMVDAITTDAGPLACSPTAGLC